jgi:hypothetical protein
VKTEENVKENGRPKKDKGEIEVKMVKLMQKGKIKKRKMCGEYILAYCGRGKNIFFRGEGEKYDFNKGEIKRKNNKSKSVKGGK